MQSPNDRRALDGVPPPMQRDEAFVTLERMIVTGRLAPGEWVSETQLIEVSGHSRASVRSAVQRLRDQELMDIFPRRGARVCPIDYTRQFRALELRRVVESLLAASAAERASPEQREAFSTHAAGFLTAAKSREQTRMTELDLANHSLMLQAADNPFASKAMASVKGLSRRFWILHHEAYGDIERMATSHAAVAAAIAGCDAAGANKAVLAVIDYVEEFTLKVVGYSYSHAAIALAGSQTD